MKSITTLINSINRATQISDILSVTNLKKEYRLIALQLHPDRCNAPGALAAMIKLNQLKVAYEKSKQLTDDTGRFEFDHCTFTFKGKRDLLNLSLEHYIKLKQFGDKSSLHFHRYLPVDMRLSGNCLKATTMQKAVPLSNLTLPEHHVLWILSRMLEVTAWFAQIGYVHGGITPESVWVVPKSHGIIIGSFYHLKPVNNRLETISAKYKNWYPTTVFNHKRAKTSTDLEMCKRTAVHLLGDKSGIGISLKKTHHPALIDFLLNTHTDAYKCYDDYRKLLKKNFKRKFHKLEL